ncbi:MAG: hypothetical protein RR982_01910 [Kiritimatiellia bacterium]
MGVAVLAGAVVCVGGGIGFRCSAFYFGRDGSDARAWGAGGATGDGASGAVVGGFGEWGDALSDGGSLPGV